MSLTAEEFQKYIVRNRKDFMALSARQERELGRLYVQFAEIAKAEADKIVNKAGLTYAQKQKMIHGLLRKAADLTDDFKGVLDKALIESADLGKEVNEVILQKYQQRLSGAGYNVDMVRVLQDIPDDVVRAVYKRIREDGLKLSDRIWQLNKRTKGELQRIIMEEIAAGRPASSKILEGRLNKLLNPDRRYVRTNLHGRNVSFDAARLLRTERTIAFREADRMAAKKNPGTQGIKWKLSPAERNCATCRDLSSSDGFGLGPGIYPPDELPFTPHPQCYDDKTEVYTDKGWKLFKDLDGEKILSLNPDGNKIEWSNYINFVSYPNRGKMIKFKSNSYDLLVTPGHRMYAKIGGKYQVKTAKELIKYSKFSLPRTANWEGKEPKEIDIDGFKIGTELYCKLMGYYLSEGSTTKRRVDSYQSVIIQHKGKSFDTILNDLRVLTNRKTDTNNSHIYLADKRLRKYLYQFGKSYEKYVPDTIKNLSSKFIRIFLDAYCLGDGSVRVNDKTGWKPNLKSKETVYSTSSNRMANDLGELILKVDKYPAFDFEANKGKPKSFKNGDYIIKTDCWRIRENGSKHSVFDRKHDHGIRFKEVDYDGFVYDVELAKNHILWVRRNGKTCWSGNCMCHTYTVTISTKQFTNNWIEWMNDKSTHPELTQWFNQVYKRAA